MILSRFYLISNFRAYDGSLHHLKMTLAQQSLARVKARSTCMQQSVNHLQPNTMTGSAPTSTSLSSHHKYFNTQDTAVEKRQACQLPKEKNKPKVTYLL